MNDQPTFAQFFEAWELFGTAASAGAACGALLGALGVYIVARRMIFLAAALSQVAGLGVALALFLGAPPLLGATALVAAAGVPVFSRAREKRRDVQMGLLFIVGASGALAVGARIHDAEEVHSLLFGSAVVVLPEQLALILAVGVVVLAVHLWWMRGFIQVSLDRDGARVRRLPVRLLDLSLLGTLVVSIALATQALGALPVFAFSVAPALGALRVSRTIPRAFALALVLGGAAGFFGYLFAFRFSLPVGATQALTAAALVALAPLLHLPGRAARYLARR